MAEVLRAVVGATFQEPVSLTDRLGNPIDLTGASLRWMAKARVDDPDVEALLSASTAGASIVIEAPATDGRIRFAIPAATMATLVPGRLLVWTLEVQAQAGTITRFPDDFQNAPGKLIVAPSVVVALP